MKVTNFANKFDEFLDDFAMKKDKTKTF